MLHKWIINNLTEKEELCKNELSQKLRISPALCTLLVQRGITTMEEANNFFFPKLKEIHDPFLLNDMDKAVKRLNTALSKREKILVYGDYDVDGTTAVALVYKFLQQYTSNIDFYIPDRNDEGYGVSYKGIDFAADNSFSLIIVLDCGIKAIEKVSYAKEKGIDIIICDHHTPDETLPDAVAVLDPKRTDSTYPYGHLSGCGVGFKLMQAFAINNEIPMKELYSLLDLLAVSIASDIVPITGENRILMQHGLKTLNSNPSLGLKAIIDVCDLKGKEITTSDIVFKIGPRINASGRMSSGKEAVELLVAKDYVSAKEKSDLIDNYNKTRKDLDKQATDEAHREILKLKTLGEKSSIVVYNQEWNKGVIGIVASRLSEQYFKPAVVLTLSNGMATGSARSIAGFDLYKAIDSCRDLLENFGGHIYPAPSMSPPLMNRLWSTMPDESAFPASISRPKYFSTNGISLTAFRCADLCIRSDAEFETTSIASISYSPRGSQTTPPLPADSTARMIRAESPCSPASRGKSPTSESHTPSPNALRKAISAMANIQHDLAMFILLCISSVQSRGARDLRPSRPWC